MQSRKRKAGDDGANDDDTRMSPSPSASPSIQSGTLPQTGRNRIAKRVRTNVNSRPLGLQRLLQTLSPDDLRGVLKTLCENHPELTSEVVTTAPRPTVDAVLSVLNQYESHLRHSFPFGGKQTSDYAYNRVKQPLVELLTALQDYTPNFLPPNEPQTSVSLGFLDAVTHMIHRLPDWDTYQNNRHKHEAYDEIAKAWASVIREAAKRGGGIQLRIGGWDDKILKHHQTSSDRLGSAMQELSASLNWMADGNSGGASSAGPSIREQLFNGTFGQGDGVRVGPW